MGGDVSQSLPKIFNSSISEHATLFIKGKILLGFPLGSSPNKPDGCAPIGLKYLRDAIFQLFKEPSKTVLRIFSIVNFVLPYGLEGFVEFFS